MGLEESAEHGDREKIHVAKESLVVQIGQRITSYSLKWGVPSFPHIPCPLQITEVASHQGHSKECLHSSAGELTRVGSPTLSQTHRTRRQKSSGCQGPGCGHRGLERVHRRQTGGLEGVCEWLACHIRSVHFISLILEHVVICNII